MSAEPIYIDTLIARLEGPSGATACPMMEPDEAEQWQEPLDLWLWTRQGPVESGRRMVLTLETQQTGTYT